MGTLIYLALTALLRVALTVYFSRIEVEGEEDIPDGPLVLAATHPNTFLDVALVATRLRRKVRFVAKAGLFKNPVAAWFLRSLGALPVERRRDTAAKGAGDGAGEGALSDDARERNARALGACEEAVAAGGAVLIFPEGTSEHGTKLLPL